MPVVSPCVSRRLHWRHMLCTMALLALAAPAANAHLDVAFVIDTTGSMGGEVAEAKARVQELTAALQRRRPHETLRWAIVAYRDKGDAYLTQVLDFTADVDKAQAFLHSLDVDGGGDGPEDMLGAIDATLALQWAQDADKMAYLIADAPPHLDYDDRKTPEALFAKARTQRVAFYPIGCRSLSAGGERFLRRLSQQTEGEYQHIGRVQDDRSLTDALLHVVDTRPSPPTETRSYVVTAVDHVEAGTVVTPLASLFAGPPAASKTLTSTTSDMCTLQLQVPAGFALPTVDVERHVAQLAVALHDDSIHVQLQVRPAPSAAPAVVDVLLPTCPSSMSLPVHVHLEGLASSSKTAAKGGA